MLLREYLALALLVPALARACEMRWHDPVAIRGVRLAGGASRREGRLEVQAGCPGGPLEWYSVMCQTAVPYRDGNDPGADPDLLPQVVCRQLGFGGGVQKLFRPRRQAWPVLAGRLRCNGSEAEVGRCAFQFWSTGEAGYCNGGEEWEDMAPPYEVGVVCSGAVPARLITGVRLEGGPTPREGRLLVKVGGKWGAVVNKSLSDTDAARAVCRQLGYSGAAAARGAAYYGRSKAPPVLQILSCQPWGRRGRRPRDGLQGCTLTRSIDPQDPNSSDGFGVWCAGKPVVSEVRLAGGLTPQDGRVEVRVDGEWRSVCANLPFDATKHQDAWTRVRAARAARAVCRSLGLRSGTPQGPVYGLAPPAALTNLACTGEEASLSQCSFTRPSVACQYEPKWVYSGSGAPTNQTAYLAVACAGAKPQLRLVGGASPREGRVALRQPDGSYRPLCDKAPAYIPIWQSSEGDFWDFLPTSGPARTICRYLGFGGGGERYESFYGNATLPALNCTGAERSPLACTLDQPNGFQGLCTTHLGVACAGAPGDVRSVRLAGGSSPAEGLLEVQLGANSVGLVQTYSSNGDSGYSGEAALAVAAAVCRQLGLGGGALRGARLYFSASQLRGVLFALRCAARAASLAECGFMRPMPEYEGLDNSLAVACHGSITVPEVRLVNGMTSQEGRVEVRLNDGRWGTIDVLNAAGGDAAARVICRQLGMGGGAAREGGFFGGGALAPALTMVSCRGGEAALEGCSFGRAPADAGGEGFPAFGVACSGSRSILGVRLMNGTRPSVAAGRVEAHVAGRGWGTVGRGRDADGNAFDAVCRMLGHRSGAEPDWTFAPGDEMGARYGLSSLPVFVGNTRCPDGAQSLEACALAASSGSDWLPLEVECTG